MPAHYALPIVSRARESATERPPGSALNPLEPLDLNSSLRQALPAVGPISTNSSRRRGRRSSRDFGTWGKPPSPRRSENRPSPNRTSFPRGSPNCTSKPSATVVYEAPSPTEYFDPEEGGGEEDSRRDEADEARISVSEW